jgi:hypothetical protein
MEVAKIYIEMYYKDYPIKPSCERVGAKARVSPSFTGKIMQELAGTGHILDPEIIIKSSWKKVGDIGDCLATETEIFLLALHLEHP